MKIDEYNDRKAPRCSVCAAMVVQHLDITEDRYYWYCPNCGEVPREGQHIA